MSITCAECSIRYAKDLPACPWCGHVPEAAPAATIGSQPPLPPIAEPAGRAEAPTHTETRAIPPPPSPLPKKTPSGSVTYDLEDIPGPAEEWDSVDEWISEGLAAETQAWTAAEPRPLGQRMKRWAVIGGGSFLLIAFGAWLAEVLPVGIGNGSEPAVAATTPATTLAPPATTTPASTAPSIATTIPPTTVPPTTTAFIEPIGTAIAASEMRIFESGFGPLEFGDDGVDAVGQLVATLGQPDQDTGPIPAPDREGGFCDGETQRQIRWGSLSVFNRVGDDGSQTFASVLLRSTDASDPDPGSTAATLSGLRLGDSLAELRSIYDGFTIDVAPETDGSLFEVRASSDGRLLLWGTTTGGDPDIVTTIRSPLRCDL